MILFLLMPFAQVSAAAPTTVPQKYPGIFISDQSSLSHDPYDPATNYENFGSQIIQEINEGLYEYKDNSATTYKPVLATGYTKSADGLNYTFSIRPNVTFTDGSPLNAYVFQYSIQRAIIMNDPSSGIWILDQSIRNASWIQKMSNENLTQAYAFLENLSVHANSEYSLSIFLSRPTSAFIPEMIFPAAYAVSPSWIITHEPKSYNTNQSDANIFGMVSLYKMFPTLTGVQIRQYLGLNKTAFPDLTNSGIVPQSAHDDPQVGYTYFTDHAMGTGPYELYSETPGVSIVLKRNNNWWNAANFHRDTKGNIDAPTKVIYKVVSETETRVLDIKNNEAHQAYIPLANLGEIMNATTHVPYINNINIYTYPSLSTGLLGFNENDTISTPGQISTNSASKYDAAYIKSNNIVKYTWNDSKGNIQYASPNNPFSALAFREAFAYAWDYNSYMNTVLNNQYNRLSGVIPAGIFGHQSDLISSGYIPTGQNLALARQLFQKVGWKGTVTINYNSGDVERQNAALLLASVINSLDVGISIKTNGVQWSTFLTLNYEGHAAMFFLGWSPDYADASDYIVPFLHTGGLYPVSMHYSNPYVDTLIDKANSMPNNNAEKSALYREIEINASQDFPYIYLFQENSVAVVNRWVTDWAIKSTGNENPMSLGTRYQYVGLESYIPNTAIANMVNSTVKNAKVFPDFTVFAVLLSFSTIAVIVAIRKKMNK